ncbi:phage portal protein [Methylobacterium nodulans]|uniref:Phage portal protein, HK97 family n=1 Tax=Methylobacterium nodulans (strain LMG 21967 / CNCM I-2342 / ORS 2060) TaxID=460265 RepID=B8ITP1_METNO|nr:phage portal protein [Methylobacterium nodulans]ACL58957.1 phage portal protein, HK97 family [Methylobacterium nodulans ORS 2060]
MRIFGLTITREKAAPTASPVDTRGGWWGIVREAFTGAWQKSVEVRLDTVLTYSAVFRCVSLIASDIAKMRLRLVSQDADGIWTETSSPSFSPVLRKPNRFQNRIQFITSWVESKLIHGNTYVLKERDSRRVVVALSVLDPTRVKPLVAPDGEVFYQLSRDDLAGVSDLDAALLVPASEIIHDRWNTLHHPLVGTSPIYACGLAAVQGIRIQTNSAHFFGNGSQPSGILVAPGPVSEENAKRLKAHWEQNFTGPNVGRVAVLGDGLRYEPMAVKASDAQLIEQLKWSAETVCSVFGVPAYKIGVGAPPAYTNIEALDAQYYAQCLQIHIESIELCLDEGLALPAPYGTEFELDTLLRMDTATQIRTYAEGVKGGLLKPDEGRAKLGLPPVTGGNAVYLQQQNFSLAALAKRDAQADPFNPSAPASPPPEPAPPPDAAEEVSRFASALRLKLAEAIVNA